MYDTIKCLYPLPINMSLEWVEFQTKDLENTLDKFTINEKGELILHEVEYEVVSEEERPYYGTPKWEGIYKTFGMLRSKPIGDRIYDYTGVVNFYSDLSGEWLYILDFTKNTIN